jgi:hypothetical protein
MSIKRFFPEIRPTLDLNFAATKRLDPRIAFTRTSTGTFVGSNGLIQTAVSGAARFDHNPTTGESLGLLVEETRTNHNTYSEQFDNAAWVKTRSSITSNTIVAPDGTLTGDKLVEDTTASNTHQISQSASLTAGTHTYSIFVKAGERSVLQAFRSNLNIDLFTHTFNLSTGTASGAGASIVSVGNDWYLCISTVTVNTTGSTGINFSINNGSTNSYTGDGTSGLFLWGAQVEAGSFPTSYIPTTTATVTRAADVATLANTGSSIFPTSAFTTVNSPYGTAGGGSTVKLVGPTVKRTAVYASDLTHAQINALASVNDEFWRWRVLGSSFALPDFLTDGQVTVDWGDGTIETLTTAEHTFSNGSGYHDIGFRLDSGTYFRSYINNNASHDTKVVALGPAPESMKLNGERAFWGCSNLEAVDATVDATGGTSFNAAWQDCSSLTSFPLINTSAGTNFMAAWYNCSSLTSFPLINTAAGTNFQNAWKDCSSLTSFPLINTSAGTNFNTAWQDCSSLTSFPLIDTAAGTNFQNAWYNCSSLTSFPLINTAAGTNFQQAWYNCSSLTNFPLINTSAGTNFQNAWKDCSSLTSFPLIDTAAGINFIFAWRSCSSLTSFPLIDTSSGTNFQSAWFLCTSLTDFPASFFDSWTGTPVNSCFNNAWNNCSALTATSVENILNSIDTSGQSAPASGVDITIDYNAGTGTPSVATAITNLKSRGWTITLNGVLQ